MVLWCRFNQSQFRANFILQIWTKFRFTKLQANICLAILDKITQIYVKAQTGHGNLLEKRLFLSDYYGRN
jgi:hypothetical protein